MSAARRLRLALHPSAVPEQLTTALSCWILAAARHTTLLGDQEMSIAISSGSSEPQIWQLSLSQLSPEMPFAHLTALAAAWLDTAINKQTLADECTLALTELSDGFPMAGISLVVHGAASDGTAGYWELCCVKTEHAASLPLEQLACRLDSLVAAAIAAPDCPIGQLSSGWQGEQQWAPAAAVPDLWLEITQQSDLWPNRLAAECRSTASSYSQMIGA